MAGLEVEFHLFKLENPRLTPADATWLKPFGPLTTKAAKSAAAAIGKKAEKISREGGEGSEGREGRQEQ